MGRNRTSVLHERSRWAGWVGVSVVGVLATIVSPSDAGGWQEMHETSDDVRLDVAPDGIATVQHHLRYRVVAGHFKSFDLVGIDPRGEVAIEAVLTPEKGGAEVIARVEPVAKTPGTLRILIDEGKGLGRGAYVMDLKYRLDLVGTKMLTRDGAMWKLAWTAPPAPEGHDGARVIIDVPAAPTEPRLAAAAESTTTLATLRRGAERDELELVRAHVPRGEAVTWAARIDPKAFPKVATPELRPPPPHEIVAPSILASNLPRALVAVGFAAIAGALAALLRAKQRAVRAAAALRGARARPLLPLPWGLGPFVYGLVTALSLAVLLWWSPVLGAILVAAAMALAAHRAPAPIGRPRGPGAWRPLSDARALLPVRSSPLPTDALDLATFSARITCVTIGLVVCGAAWLLRRHVPQIAVALPLASAALVPVFVTGTRAQMLPTAWELAACMLRPARDALSSAVDLSHVDLGTIGRVVGASAGDGSGNPTLGAVDELRLACAPRDRTPGLRTIELALATCLDGRGAVPEVFVRFDDASAAASRMARIAPGARLVVGRTPEERVVRLRPEEPTPRAAAALLGRLLLSLEGRRAADRSSLAKRVRWQGKERRGPVLGRAGAARVIGVPPVM